MSSFPDFACSRSERPCLRSTINWWKAEIKLQNRHIYERQITQKTPDDNCKSYQQQKQQQLLQEQQRTTPKIVSTFLRFVVVKVVVIFFFSFLCQPILFLSPVSFFFLLNTRTLFPLFRHSKRERANEYRFERIFEYETCLVYIYLTEQWYRKDNLARLRFWFLLL